MFHFDFGPNGARLKKVENINVRYNCSHSRFSIKNNNHGTGDGTNKSVNVIQFSRLNIKMKRNITFDPKRRIKEEFYFDWSTSST